MKNELFQDELVILKELAAEFSLANPALAPLLQGEMADPDVERLLEAIAYQNNLLCRKLDFDFPKLINTLTQLLLPHYLRTIPAATIVKFTIKNTTGKTELVPAGSRIASAPVDGAPCLFTTIGDAEAHPLELTDAVFVEQPGHNGLIRLSLTLTNTTLSRWQPKRLRLFLSGDHASASELYMLLGCHLKRIILTALEGGAALVLPPGCLKPVGFDDNEALFPYPPMPFQAIVC